MRAPALAVAALLITVTASPAQHERSLGDASDAVLRQLAAFRAGDWDGAYRYASSAIQALFDRAAFERMVRNGYPEIAESVAASVTDGEMDLNGAVFITVIVRGANGRSVEAYYEMVREPAGWRINGVVTRPVSSSRST